MRGAGNGMASRPVSRRSRSRYPGRDRALSISFTFTCLNFFFRIDNDRYYPNSHPYADVKQYCNGHLPLAAMDAAAIAIQRNTVKQHRIMCTRGIKFTHTGPTRTAAVA
eukprot:scaffold1404_cov243-Chaetoceros_neogracile.AAC.2